MLRLIPWQPSKEMNKEWVSQNIYTLSRKLDTPTNKMEMEDSTGLIGF